VNDYAGLLSRNEVVSLERKLVAYNDSTSTQIAIVIEPSLEGEDDFDRSVRIAQAWGIGQGEEDNGLLIYVARDDRKVRIQTGYGMEDIIPDAIAKRIIEQLIIPAFRQGRYYQGLDQATTLMIDMAQGRYSGDSLGSGNNEERSFPIFTLIIIFIIIWVILSNTRGGDDDDGGYHRGGRYGRRGGGWIIFPGGGGGGWSGGGGFGGGGGGFGGFGGGGFGGGGAGGSW
jgi:uncharacterized protein